MKFNEFEDHLRSNVNCWQEFFALKGAPYMVYLYSHIKFFDNVKTSRYISQKGVT